jgi:hypothetical protein
MDDSQTKPITLLPYYEALTRLEEKGIKITLKAVAIEAGRTPGSIKKSRPVFAPLIREIRHRAELQSQIAAPGAMKAKAAKLEIKKIRARSDNYEEKYKAALARELMLLLAWDKATQELRAGKVVPLKSPKRP